MPQLYTRRSERHEDAVVSLNTYKREKGTWLLRVNKNTKIKTTDQPPADSAASSDLIKQHKRRTNRTNWLWSHILYICTYLSIYVHMYIKACRLSVNVTLQMNHVPCSGEGGSDAEVDFKFPSWPLTHWQSPTKGACCQSPCTTIAQNQSRKNTHLLCWTIHLLNFFKISSCFPNMFYQRHIPHNSHPLMRAMPLLYLQPWFN